MTNGPTCFWSYTHRDDELDGGRVGRLADAITNAYELLTGDPLKLFVDRDHLGWGDELRATIDAALTRTAFFIPVITPLYLRSEECRREFVQFVGRVSGTNAAAFLMPILYVDTPSIRDENVEDEVARLVREVKYVDWRKVRLVDENSQEYRSAVDDLATRLVEKMGAQADLPIPTLDTVGDDEPGLVDQVAVAEENAGAWAELLAGLSEAVGELGSIANDSTEELHASDRRGGGMRGRLVVLRQFGEKASVPADRINSLGVEFSRSVVAADPGIQALIREGSSAALDTEGRESANEFFGTVRELARRATEASTHTRTLASQIHQVSSLSRVARAPLTKIRNGLSATLDAVTVLNAWAESIGQVEEPP